LMERVGMGMGRGGKEEAGRINSWCSSLV
jgi:hypothetical protein